MIKRVCGHDDDSYVVLLLVVSRGARGEKFGERRLTGKVSGFEVRYRGKACVYGLKDADCQ